MTVQIWRVMEESIERDVIHASVLERQSCHAFKICKDLVDPYGYKDAAVAGLLSCALYGKMEHLVLDHAPITLNWSDCVPGVNVFTLGLCVTDILHYGDIPDFMKFCDGVSIEWQKPLNADGTDAAAFYIRSLIQRG